ncbi:hypothetical protein [Shewanella algae]|uniref:hypothetical protein n=2 Tax=Shewanella TaxID=22 RepID=UPI0030079C41
MKNLNSKGRSLSRMYCNASLSYKPMIAIIGKPEEKTEQQLKEKACNQLILVAVENSSFEIVKLKDKACTEAK